MKKFEYTTVEVPVKSIWTGRVNHEVLLGQLNQLGAEGWEIASQSSPDAHTGSKTAFIILKREIN